MPSTTPRRPQRQVVPLRAGQRTGRPAVLACTLRGTVCRRAARTGRPDGAPARPPGRANRTEETSTMTGLAFMSSTCPEWTFEQMVDAAVKYGYEGVDLRVEWGHHHGLELDSDPGRPPGGPQTTPPPRTSRSAASPSGPAWPGPRRRSGKTPSTRCGATPSWPPTWGPPRSASSGATSRRGTRWPSCARPRRRPWGAPPRRRPPSGSPPAWKYTTSTTTRRTWPGSWSTPAAPTPASSGTPPTTCAWESPWTTPTPSCAPGCATCTCKTGPRGASRWASDPSFLPIGEGDGHLARVFELLEGDGFQGYGANEWIIKRNAELDPDVYLPAASRHLHAWRDAARAGGG